ncbi:MAG: DNA ligase-associated DEXH box helicase, partial [Alphaproteobacteria bacterium]|nr:DNA ligase-associated DEXH box helicase [Alphaproteobacteria bacterium]
THGQSEVLSRYLGEALQIEAMPLKTLFTGQEGDV